MTLPSFCLRIVGGVLLCAFMGYAAQGDAPSGNMTRSELRKKLGDDDLKSLCSGMKACLDIDVPGCDELDKKPQKRIDYDESFCGIYKDIVSRGLGTDLRAPMAPEIFARLGRKYRAVYVSEGTLPMDQNVMSYLFDNMPFTAQLMNAYLDTEYSLEYTSADRRFFSGSNGGSLSGEFYWALQDSAGAKLGMRDLFFGYGHAKILRWSLTGTAIAFLDMDPVPGKKLKYKLTAIVFPGNSVLNSIMQMKIFRNVVNEKLDEIVGDVRKASASYFGGNKEPLLKSAVLKSRENVQYVLDFETVVNGSPWKLGDFKKLEKERAKANAATPLQVEIQKNVEGLK